MFKTGSALGKWKRQLAQIDVSIKSDMTSLGNTVMSDLRLSAARAKPLYETIAKNPPNRY